MVCEVIFVLDIILRFFVARNVEGDESEFIIHIEKLGLAYLKGSFWLDLLLILPLGFIGKYYSDSYQFLHLVKSMRIQKFFKFLEPTFFGPYIRNYYGNKLKEVLKNEDKKNDIIESNNFIIERIKMRNYINSARISLAILGSIYFSSILWFIIINELSKRDEDDENAINFMTHFKLNAM